MNHPFQETNGAGRVDAADNILELKGIAASYGRSQVLWDVSVAIKPGSIAALLGPNGAGKTTLLKVAAGLLTPSAGTVNVQGEDVTTSATHRRAALGVCLVPEGRGVFANLTVKENLLLQVPPWSRAASLEPALEAFPVLRDRLSDRAGRLSGGQQQMLALARCYLARPRIALLDEVSMGLAPRVVEEIFESIRALAASGVALLVVEQYVNRALKMADTVHLLSRGRLTYSGPPDALDEQAVLRGYLGAGF